MVCFQWFHFFALFFKKDGWKKIKIKKERKKERWLAGA
jgi:hypothetical protein